MPPPSKKDLCLIVFDTHSSEKDKLLEGLLRISSYKQVVETNDLYRLILANTIDTKNELDYPNVFLTGVNDLDPKDVEGVIKSTESEEGDWLDAILVGIYYLEQCSEMPGIITQKLIYFSTLDNTSKLDDKKIQEITTKLNESNIYFYIIGPNLELPFTITSVDDIVECMQQLQVDESNSSLVAAKKLVQNTNKAVVCPLNVGLHLLFSFKESKGSQPWKVPLSFGTQLTISANTVKIYRTDQGLGLMKDSASKTSRQVLAEDESVEVKFHDTVRGVLRQGKFVEITDNKMFQIQGERSFDVLGFTEQKFVTDAYIIGNETYTVLPDETNQNSYELFCNLVQVLSEQKKYIIARRIYFNNCKPKFYVLIPQVQKEPPQFLMAEVPFADDVREDFNIEEPNLVDEKIDNNIQNFCESIDIFANKSEVPVPLAPNMMLDWYSSKLINAAAGKFLSRDFEFYDTDYVGTNNSSKYIDELKESWPETTE